MRKSIYRVFLCAAVAALAVPTPSQVVRSRVIATRSPYTAHYKLTRTQKLADGNVIRSESTETTAVDAQGRHMTATTGTLPFEGQTARTMVFVFDPAARTNTNWASPGQQATVSMMPEPGARRGCPANSTELNSNPVSERMERSKPVIEKLGIDTFQGVEAQGRRITNTIPVGEIGNQSPIVTTSETWTATEPTLAGMVVRQTSDDPRSGSRTKELISYEPGDPDPALFQPPSSYEIVKSTMETLCPGQTTTTSQQ